MCLDVFLFGSRFFGTLWASCTCTSISYAKLGKFSFIIFSNKFWISCFSLSSSGTPMMRVLECLKLSQRLLTLSSIFWYYSFFLLYWLDAFSSVFQIIDLILSFIPSPVGSLYIFLYFTLYRLYFFILWLYSVICLSILITSVLNSVSDRLSIPISFSSFSGILFSSFIWATFLCILNLAASLCLFLCIRCSCFDSCLSAPGKLYGAEP